MQLFLKITKCRTHWIHNFTAANILYYKERFLYSKKLQFKCSFNLNCRNCRSFYFVLHLFHSFIAIYIKIREIVVCSVNHSYDGSKITHTKFRQKYMCLRIQKYPCRWKVVGNMNCLKNKTKSYYQKCIRIQKG